MVEKRRERGGSDGGTDVARRSGIVRNTSADTRRKGKTPPRHSRTQEPKGEKGCPLSSSEGGKLTSGKHSLMGRTWIWSGHPQLRGWRANAAEVGRAKSGRVGNFIIREKKKRKCCAGCPTAAGEGAF